MCYNHNNNYGLGIETMTNEELTRRIFQNDGYVKLSGVEIVEIGEQSVTARADIQAQHLNANGSVQGGMLYTLADVAFAVLANYLHPITVTQCGHINYVRAAYTKTVTAVARETVRSGHNCISEVVIYDDKNEVCCICNFNGFVKETDREALKEKYSHN